MLAYRPKFFHAFAFYLEYPSNCKLTDVVRWLEVTAVVLQLPVYMTHTSPTADGYPSDNASPTAQTPSPSQLDTGPLMAYVRLPAAVNLAS